MSHLTPPILTTTPTPTDAAPATAVDRFAIERETAERLIAGRARIEAELGKVIVGQREVIEQIMIALLAGGHCLITGAQGLAKTLRVTPFAQHLLPLYSRDTFLPHLQS